MNVKGAGSKVRSGEEAGHGFLARLSDFQQLIAVVAAILGIVATIQSTRNSARLGDIESRLASLREERFWAKELYSQFDAIVSAKSDDQLRVDRLTGLLTLTELTDQPKVKEQLAQLITHQAARYKALLAAGPSANTPEGKILLQQYQQLQSAAGDTAVETRVERLRQPLQSRPVSDKAVPATRDVSSRPAAARPTAPHAVVSRRIRYPKDLSLEQLEQQIAMVEAAEGPLTGLGLTEEGTVATFRDGIAPGGTVKLVIGSPPDGYRRIWQGQVWIGNERQTIAAVRQE